MKFCKDCEFYRAPIISAFAQCNHSQAILSYDLVTGYPARYSCKLMRENQDRCGTEAQLFKEKEVVLNLWSHLFACKK